MVKTSIPQLRKVTFKDGRQLTVFRPEYLNDKKHIAKRTADLIDGFFRDEMPVAGFALVIWNPDGGHMVAQSTFVNSSIPKALAPDFVRNALLLNLASDW